MLREVVLRARQRRRPVRHAACHRPPRLGLGGSVAEGEGGRAVGVRPPGAAVGAAAGVGQGVLAVHEPAGWRDVGGYKAVQDEEARARVG